MEITPASLIDALEETWTATIEVCRDLTDEQWDKGTGCPGWNVKDHLSHLCGIEAQLLGRTEPEHELPDYPHIRNDFGRAMEVAVDIRRPRPAKEVLAEFEELSAARLAQLRSLDASAFAAEMPGPLGGTMKGTDMLAIRLFDCWIHEQDIRRAVESPGGMQGRAIALLLPRIQRGLARVASTTAGLPPGTSVAFEIDGLLSTGFTIEIGDDGRGEVRAGADHAASAIIRTGGDNFIALVGGRADADRDAIDVTGDAAAAGNLVDQMGITP